MTRPKINLPTDGFDRAIQLIGGVLLILLIIHPLYHFMALPDSIPVHFNASGEPDRFGSKYTIWFMPILGIVLYIGLSIVTRYPHTYNYVVRITEENAKRQYFLATKLMRILNLQVVLIFFYINYGMIQTALGQSNGLGSLVFPIITVPILGTLIWYLYQSLKKG